MLILYINIDFNLSVLIPDIIYKYIQVTNDDDKRCLIYRSADNNRLFVFTHITYNQDIIINNINLMPLTECSNVTFYYERRVPMCLWSEFCLPYTCDPSIVYDLASVHTAFNYIQPLSNTIISTYAPLGLVSDDIIGKVKYITKERLDIKTYDMISNRYPNVLPIRSTISEVREISHSDTSDIISKIRGTTLDTAALILFEYLQHRVICSSIEEQTIYIFTDMWYKDIGHACLNRLMMYEMPQYVCNVVVPANGTIDEEEMLEYFLSSRRDIITRLCFLCESKSFSHMLDDKVNIIALSDGVYDFDTDIFRRARASDYISISTGTPFISTNIEHGIYALKNILSTFFPDINILEFFLSTVALSLGGRNFEKIVVVWIGRTDSGKSTCQEFIEHVLGDYCSSLPSSMLVGKRSSPHGTTSALSAIGKKRLLFIQEPEEAKINSSQLKSLSGNDTIYTREIYEKGTTTRVKAITTIVTNGRMDFSGCDQAALSRIIVIPFMSTFVTSRERYRYNNNNNIVEADIKVSDKLKQLSTPMLHILVNKYREYLRSGYNIPEVIREHIDEFISNSNPAIYFMKKYIIFSKGARTQMSILFSYFSSWYKDAYPGNKIMPLYQFRETIRSSGYDIEIDFLVDHAFIS